MKYEDKLNSHTTHLPKHTIGERGYLSALKAIRDMGYESNKERTGTGTIVYPTPIQLHFPTVDKKFPLFTTKRVYFNMFAVEMLWLISGRTDVQSLEDLGSKAMKNTWSLWADENGDLGKVYGYQWRHWNTTDGGEFDQLAVAIDMLKNNPESRRIRVTAWRPDQLDEMALPPCHLDFQFTCEYLPEKDNYRLHLHLLQRSCDMFLGVPFNVGEYSLLLIMVANLLGYEVGGFTWTGTNCHIYSNHLEAINTQLNRNVFSPPSLEITRKVNNIEDYRLEDFKVVGYKHHPPIKAKVSV